MTLQAATSPDAITMRSMVREIGQDATKAAIALAIKQADDLCGGKCSDDALVMMAGLAMQKFAHRSYASVIMAIRDGISYSDEDGRVYGSITWPKLSMWLDRHEASIMGLAESEHAASVVKNDNLDGRYLDAQERNDPSRKLEQKDRLIEQLRRKLETKKP